MTRPLHRLKQYGLRSRGADAQLRGRSCHSTAGRTAARGMRLRRRDRELHRNDIEERLGCAFSVEEMRRMVAYAQRCGFLKPPWNSVPIVLTTASMSGSVQVFERRCDPNSPSAHAAGVRKRA